MIICPSETAFNLSNVELYGLDIDMNEFWNEKSARS